MSSLPDLIKAEKIISFFPGWSQPEPETTYSWFDAPLDIGGITVAGLTLHGGCHMKHPDKHVTFELRVGRSASSRLTPLMRLDWRSLNGTHQNPRRGSSEWSGRQVSETHLHSFDLNWIAEENRLRLGNLRMAMEIPEPLQTFEDVREFCRKSFNIKNMDVVYKPNWVYDLFRDL